MLNIGNIVFDQYQRYCNAKLIIDSLRQDRQIFRILEVGANEHRNLEKFLPEDNISYLDIYLSEEMKKQPQFIEGDATDMSFADDEFDIVVALDVYEHILPEKREAFMREAVRVASTAAIVCAPFDDPLVHEAEKRMNCAYRALYGHDHPWLIEHIDNGLPDLEWTKKLLEDMGVLYKTFGHGRVSIWERMMYMQEIADYDPALRDYFELISDIYDRYIFPCDYSDSSYRKFISVFKREKTEGIFFTESNEVIKEDARLMLNQSEHIFYTLFSYCRGQNQLRGAIDKKDKEISQLRGAIDKKDRYINELLNSKCWKITAPLRMIGRSGKK